MKFSFDDQSVDTDYRDSESVDVVISLQDYDIRMSFTWDDLQALLQGLRDQ
jgi:hypothetical protein